jgi:hypothetical protein
MPFRFEKSKATTYKGTENDEADDMDKTAND